MTTKPTVTLKEIASAADVSEDTVRRHLDDWGLNKCKSEASKRPHYFFRKLASDQLIRVRVISEPL